MDYISKNTIKESKCKQIFTQTFRKVQKEIKKEGLTFSFNLVGSAKRNMIVDKSKNPNILFDCDYQLFLQKNKKQLSAKQIKTKLISCFDKFFPDNFYYCQDSTTAITTRCDAEIPFGYDIVIIDANQDIPQIIRRKNQNYTWNELPEEKNYPSNLAQIEGPEMWAELRERYLDKKGKQYHNKYPIDRKSFQILNEAINETIDCFE